MEKLCPNCLSLGKCLFKEYASQVVKELEAKNITDQEILLSAAIEVHQKISDERIRAREKECPNINDIDPHYPGKELL